MRKTVALVAAVAAVALICACGSAVNSAAAGSTVVLSQHDAGRTVQVHVGDTVRLTLEESFPVPGSSLVWVATSSDPSILAPGAVSRSPQMRSGPGGHDTYTADFAARSGGQAMLQARGSTTCEAMAKQYCPDQVFTINIVVASA
jgi:FtsP/CotA-like multicopper oxidase with cupredoxin domain